MFETIAPKTFVAGFINLAEVLSFSISPAVFDLTDVVASIFPGKSSRSCDIVVDEGTLVGESIEPGIGALTVHEAVLEHPVVCIAVVVLDTTYSCEEFVVDLVVDFGLDIAVPL